MVIDSKGHYFWIYLDELIAQSKIIIDRPKGSVHPRYPQIVYELDYGYLDGQSLLIMRE